MTRFKVVLEVHLDTDLTELKTVGLARQIVGADEDARLKMAGNPHSVLYGLLSPAIQSALESAFAAPDVDIVDLRAGLVVD